MLGELAALADKANDGRLAERLRTLADQREGRDPVEHTGPNRGLAN
jgi:hypothetical protein